MAPISLEAFLSGQVFKMPILEVFVHKIIDDTTYLIADNTRVARMTVKQNPKLGKNISCNISVRIVNAIVEDEIVVLTPSTHILQCKPVQHKSPTMEEESTPEATFDEIGHQPIGSNIPSVAAKVTFLSPKKKAKFSGQSRVAGVRHKYIFCD